MTPAAVAWHLDGEHGISSRAIFDRLTFGRTSGEWSNHPSDPDDFRRCELLLRAVPEFRARFSEMAAESEIWALLVEHWSEIHEAIEADVPGYLDGARGRATRGYDLMTRLIYGRESAA